MDKRINGQQQALSRDRLSRLAFVANKNFLLP